ncbi:MAG: hypothetical protein OXI27_09745 [Thaumarchaeota archaeon]|nr:hypothetical protein [Nitrososphaerota archaeon]
MNRVFLVAGLAAAAGLLVLGGGASDSWAAQLDATIIPTADASPFKMSYLKTIHIWYENGGVLVDELRGNDITVSGQYDSSHPDVQSLIERLNTAILQSGSQVSISDMEADYTFALYGGEERASLDYKVILSGMLVNYVITQDSQKTLVDLGWRGLSVDGSVMIDGQEINDPFTFVADNLPVTRDTISGTAGERIFDEYLLNADFVLEQPLENWHFLFDPTGINVDAGTFGLGDEISGFVKSSWTMGESNLQQGRQVERIEEEIIMVDQEYVVKSIQSPDQGNLNIIGYGVIDVLEGVEIAGVTSTAPRITATGDFPIMIIYGMAGMAAVAGIAFFFVSNRALKNEKQGQQGIDPTHLVGYQTSSASGGYQTNRGEAQLKGDADYQMTRSHYEQEQPQQQQSEPSSTLPAIAAEDAACGCAASAEMSSECDCQMQGSCICDHTCQCGADLCKETSESMR